VRAAAIVNANARRLRGPLRARLERVLPGAVTFTRSLDEARVAIRAEVARGADLIALGGGDGTVVMGLTLIEEACRGAGRPEPAIGVLRLGAANAIADAAGAGDDPASDLERLARGEAAWRAMPMLRVLGVRAPFVGIGAGAQLLEDREAVDRLVDRVPVARRLVGEATRAALSKVLRSAPRLAAEARPRAVIANLGAPAIELLRGAPSGRELDRGATIWSGACALIAGAAIPHFAAETRLSAPAGGRADRFRLRCGDVGLRALLRGAPGPLRGPTSGGPAADFLCDHVEIRLDAEAAVEAGGELLGRRRELELRIAPPVTVATLGRDPQ
jgi:hypothetical protein